MHTGSDQEDQCQPDWSHLPQAIWNDIVAFLFNDIIPPYRALTMHTSLCMSGENLRTAAGTVCLNLDLRHATNVQLEMVKNKQNVLVERLYLGDLEAGESVLKSENFYKRCRDCLVGLSAFITTTDTLQKYPNLKALELHSGEGFRKLYPAVLAGLRSLQHLRLMNYIYDTGITLSTDQILQVPLELLMQLDTLYIQPKPGHLLNTLNLSLPSKELVRAHIPTNTYVRSKWHNECIRLKCLQIDASFDRLQHSKAAPIIILNMRTLNAAQYIKLQGDDLLLQLDAPMEYGPTIGNLHFQSTGALDIAIHSVPQVPTEFFRQLQSATYWEEIILEYTGSLVLHMGGSSPWSTKGNIHALMQEFERQCRGPYCVDIQFEAFQERRGILDITVLRLSRILPTSREN